MSDYSATFPTQRPVFTADFSNGSKIDPRATFTRASTANVFDGSKHLSDENYATYSEQFDQWTQVGMSSTANATAAPDGNTTADLLYPTAASAYAWQGNILAAGTTRQKCCSFYVKANSWTWIVIGPNGGGRVWFDIASGTKGTESSGYTGTISAVGSTGWYRVSVESNDTTSLAPIIYCVDADNSGTATPSGTNGVYVWGCKAELGVTTPTAYVTATGSQLLREYAPTLVSKANNAARFETATDGQSEGILIESSRTNLITYSNNFGAWSALRVTAEAGASVGPDGQSCYVMREDSTAANTHYLSLGASGQSTSTTYTMSVYAKKVATSNQTRHLRLRVNGIGGEASVEYNLANGTVNRTTGTSLDSSSISSIGNGWYRLVMTYTNPGGSVASGMIITGSPDNDQTLPSYDGDGYTSFALFGAMVEAGSHASSLITSNSGSQTTRAADSLSVATADIGYTGGDATVFVESTSSGGDFPGLIGLDDGGSVNCMRVFRNSGSATSTTDFQFNVNDSSGSNQVASVVSGSGAGTKFAMRLAENNAAFAFDGNTPTTDTSCVMPVTTTLDIGSGAGVSEINGTIKRVALYSEALSDTNLQALTS